MATDLTVVLRGGTYDMTLAPFVVSGQDSGLNGHQMIYTAFPGERPVLSGGVAISGWTQADPALGIWKASVPAGLNTRQLYVNGRRAQRASSNAPLPGTPTQDSIGYLITDPTLSTWRHPEDLEFVYTGAQAHAADCRWTEDRISVASITTAGGSTRITMQQPAYGLALAKGHQAPNVPSSYENAFELLTQPGSWYLDHHADVLYYIPRPGEDLATAHVVAPVAESLLEGNGTTASPLHNVTFSGLTLSYATWLLPNTSGVVPIQAQYTLGYPQIPANVTVHGASSVIFQRDVFAHLGACALNLDQGSNACSIIGCVFTDISGCGIDLGERVRQPSPGMQTINNSITDNLISGFGVEYRGSVGISTGYIANTLIAHNEISYGPYTGISLGMGTGGASYAANNHVTANNIHHILSTLDDGAAIYTFMMPMPGSSIDNNYIHDFDTKLYGGGIYPDEQSANLSIHDNVLVNVPRWLRVWIPSITNITVDNNYSTSATMLNMGTNVSVTNTTILTGTYPASAMTDVTLAGMDSDYQGISQESVDPSYTTSAPSHSPSTSQSLSASAPNPASSSSSHGCGLGTGVGCIWLILLGTSLRQRRPSSRSSDMLP